MYHPKETKTRIKIKKDPSHKSGIVDSLRSAFSIVHISSTNDSTIPGELQLDLPKDDSFPVSDDK